MVIIIISRDRLINWQNFVLSARVNTHTDKANESHFINDERRKCQPGGLFLDEHCLFIVQYG